MTADDGGNWFDDDPEWADLRRRVDGQPIQKSPKQPRAEDKHKKPSQEPQKEPNEPKKVELSVNVSLPKPTLPKLPKPTRRQMILGGSATGVIMVGIVGILIVSSLNKDDKKEVAGANTEHVSKPTFDTVTPDNKSAEAFGGFVKISPPESEPVFAIVDKIGNTEVKVTQQKLPKSFTDKNTDEEVQKMAEGFSANDILKESNPKAYIGTNVTGAQSVIFHKNGLLIFITSTKEIDRDLLAEYITKLQ